MDLFEKLRQLRKSLAQKARLPPFMIFSDASLIEMSALLPKNEDQLLEVNGMGQKKLIRYGRIFLKAIREYQHATA